MGATPTTPYNWKDLLTPAIGLGVKAIGDKLAPSTDQQAVQNQAGQNRFTDQLALARRADSNRIRQSMMPGMYTTLGFTPEQGQKMASDYGVSAAANNANIQVPGNGSGGGGGGGGAPGLGATIGKAAVGFAPAAIGGIAHLLAGGGAAAGAGATGGLSALAATGIGAAVAAPIIAGLIWKKSQAHPTADKWTQGEQGPFDKAWAATDKSGLPPDQVQAAHQQSAQNYLNELQNFAQQGGKNLTVAKQAAATFRQYYGDPMKYGVQLPF